MSTDSQTLNIHRRTLPIPLAASVSITVDGFARRVLKVAVPRDEAIEETALDVWYEVYPDSPHKTTIRFFVVGTGEEMSPPLPAGAYLDSVITPAGLVWHVYGDTEVEMSK